MSLIVSAVHRRAFDPDRAEQRMLAVVNEIAPEPVRASARCDVRRLGSHVQGTLNLPDHYPRRDLSLCQGKLYDSEATWWHPGSGVPDGSFAIIRDGVTVLEAVSDPAASRMLWYYHDDELFVVSNSERAVTMYSGRFAFNRDVVPWVVSTGTRGLGGSYNLHLHLLPPSATATLDKSTWRLRVEAPEIRFAEIDRGRTAHQVALESALEQTFASFRAADAQHALISLSGGCDSRALAIFLSRDADAGWRSFAGGSAKAASLPGSDVSVAARVAKALRLEHRHIVTDAPPPASIDTLLRRFVLTGEGRHDHLNRLDGGTVHRALQSEGVSAIVRGDEGFGWKPVPKSPVAVRQSMELLLCGDIANLQPHLAAFGLDKHELPEALQRRPGESIETWRDRLYHGFRMTTVLAALTEHKAAYFDVISPLLSRRALEVTRGLPDELREDKALFRELVLRLGPDEPFAGREGGPNRLENLRIPEVRRTIRDALATETAERTFGRPLVRWMRSEIDPTRHALNRTLHAAKGRLRRRLPRLFRAQPSPRLDPLRLAFRIYIATVMIDRLEADARLVPVAAPVGRAA